MEKIIDMFPSELQKALSPFKHTKTIEEIRLRIGQNIEIIHTETYTELQETRIKRAHLQHLLAQMMGHSFYRYEEQVRKGYFTIDGGHRIGIAGHVVLKDDSIHQIANISFINIRIAKPLQAKYFPIISYLRREDKWHNTCIIGPPQSGKTTLLRHIAKTISDGTSHQRGRKVSIIDERSEIAGMHELGPLFSVGRRTDILDNCPKHLGIMMAIRSLSPEVLIVDEIGSSTDVQAIQEAIYAGVHIICTIHAFSLRDIFYKKSLAKLLENKSFTRFIVLRRMQDRIQVNVYDQLHHLIGKERMVIS